MRILAVDWSGDARQARRRIWLAEADGPGRLARLEAGRDRADLAEHLRRLTGDVVVGLDFGFSFPAWFIAQLGVHSAPDLWALVADRGERWLTDCRAPFWGRRGPRPNGVGDPLRRTERAVPATAGIRPRSMFQIGGAGAVGTGSIRGMPLLHRLHLAGASIWPFVRGGSPKLVEIYPRLLTGPVTKSDPAARARYLAGCCPHLDRVHREQAIASEDAFDATVSALTMVAHAADLASLPSIDADAIVRLEGRIWHPAWRSDPL